MKKAIGIQFGIQFDRIIRKEGMLNPAQVFISCGQREDLGEIEIADRVAQALADEGFQPYVATRQQTLRGLKENIFEKLAESEYFIFIDFKRELLAETDPPACRGSVFSQQELAVAANLDLELIAFQEEGVKPLEGILSFMQANCIPFSNRSTLPDAVLKLVRKRGWSSVWKNCLTVESEISVQRNVLRTPEDIIGDFYHLTIKNNHFRKTARNVYGYLRSVLEAETNNPVDFGTAEFKWAGYMLPNATIHPQGNRRLDALWIPHTDPNNPRFNCFTDSTAFIPRIQGPGAWLLEYSVFSDTIRGSSRKFRLSLNGTVEGVSLIAI